MSSRHLTPVVAAGKMDAVCEGLCFALRWLAEEACPKCGQRTLDVEMTLNSGVVVFCDGIDREAEDGQCAFERIALLSDYRPKLIEVRTPDP